MENGSAEWMRGHLQDFYAVLPAFVQKILRKFPVGNDDIDVGESAKAETAFHTDF